MFQTLYSIQKRCLKNCPLSKLTPTQQGRPKSASKPYKSLRPQARLRRHRCPRQTTRRPANHTRRPRLVTSPLPHPQPSTNHPPKRGGFVIWRAAAHYPSLITHVFSVCTPYTAPHKEYLSTEALVKGPLPQFAYQLHLASGEVEKSVNDEASIRQFLKGLYGARGPGGEVAFDPEKGVIKENLPKIGESRILNGEVCCCFCCYSGGGGGGRSLMCEEIANGQNRSSSTMSSSTRVMVSILHVRLPLLSSFLLYPANYNPL